MEATANAQTIPDFSQLAEQLTKLSEFFQGIEDKTKVYMNNTEGTNVSKLVQAADIVRSRQEKKLEKAQYIERKRDAKDEYSIQKEIARKEYQIRRKLNGNVTFEKIHYIKDAFRQSRTHKNAIVSAISALITGFSLGRKQTQINRYKKQIALISAKEEYRATQKRTLEAYVKKQKDIADQHKSFVKSPRLAAKAEKERQRSLKNLDSKPFDIKEALDIGLVPKYGTPEYRALPKERKEALKLATKQCMNPGKNSTKKATYKDFRTLAERYEEMLLLARQSRTIPIFRTNSPKRNHPHRNPQQTQQKSKPRTR